MNRDSILTFINALGGENIIDRGDWIMCSCIFAADSHTNGTDSNPSFGISINNENKLVYHCFTCSPDIHPIERLLHNLWLLSGKYPYELAKLFSQLDAGASNTQPKKVNKDVWDTKVRIDKKAESLDDDVLENFPLINGSSDSTRAKDYLQSRDISTEIIYKLGVRYWTKNGSVIFPHTDCNGGIYILRHRGVETKVLYTITNEMAKVKREFPKFSNSGAWFGLHLINWSKPVMLVEGCIDVLRLHELGLTNCIASGSAYAHKKQFESLLCSSVILGYDMDSAGMLARKRCIKFLKDKMIICDVNWSLARSRRGFKCKDAGDLADRKELVKVLKEKTIL